MYTYTNISYQTRTTPSSNPFFVIHSSPVPKNSNKNWSENKDWFGGWANNHLTEIAGVRDQGNFIDLNSVRRDKRGGTPMCLDIGCEDVSERGYEDIREDFGYKDVLASKKSNFAMSIYHFTWTPASYVVVWTNCKWPGCKLDCKLIMVE